MYIYVHQSTHIHANVYKYSCTSKYTYTRKRIQILIYTQIQNKYEQKRTCIRCIRIYIHKHIYTHTCTSTYTYTCKSIYVHVYIYVTLYIYTYRVSHICTCIREGTENGRAGTDMAASASTLLLRAGLWYDVTVGGRVRALLAGACKGCEHHSRVRLQPLPLTGRAPARSPRASECAGVL